MLIRYDNKVVDETDQWKIYVSHPKMFPDASITDEFLNLKGINRLRRILR